MSERERQAEFYLTASYSGIPVSRRDDTLDSLVGRKHYASGSGCDGSRDLCWRFGNREDRDSAAWRLKKSRKTTGINVEVRTHGNEIEEQETHLKQEPAAQEAPQAAPGASAESRESSGALTPSFIESTNKEFEKLGTLKRVDGERNELKRDNRNLQAEVERLHARILDFLAAYKNSPNWDRLFGDVGALAAAIGFEDRQLAAHWERRLKQENEVAELRERSDTYHTAMQEEWTRAQDLQAEVAELRDVLQVTERVRDALNYNIAEVRAHLSRIAEAATILKGGTYSSGAEYHAAVERLLETIATEVKP